MIDDPWPIYPDLPGERSTDTSRAAAAAVAPRDAALRARVLDRLKVAPATPDEIAAEFGESVLSIRPRCSQLKKQRLVRDTGERRNTTSGHAQAVLAALP